MLAPPVDTDSAYVFRLDEHLAQAGAHEVGGRAAAAGQTGRQSLPGYLLQVALPAGITVVVRAEASRQETQTVTPCPKLRAERVGQAGLEPADRPGTRTTEHDRS